MWYPISFTYDSALAAKDSTIKDPAALNNKSVRLDHYSQLQCTTCHNPHDDQYGNFLVMDNTGSALCMVCHLPPGWTGSAHAISAKVSPLAIQFKAGVKFEVARSKTASIATLGCDNCHAPHQTGSRKTLLVNRVPEQNCLVCRSGTTAAKNIASDFQKLSIHPITLNSQAHNAAEDVINPPVRHVTCNDCHNPHAAHAATANAPNVTGALAGVKGVSAGGGIITRALKEYEVCFRCHADSLARGPATVPRQIIQTNARLEFSPGNQSYHPVIAPGKNHSVPSLIAPLTTLSLTYCTDCHNSDQSPRTGGAGANGPHGSICAPILERNLATVDFEPESSFSYALCYKCHSRSSVLANQSFRYHQSHVVNDQTACTTCHDSHGVSGAPHLINFNTTYVTPSSNGRLEYMSYGSGRGNCSLTCHGKDHRATPY
jgi:predicted CXXCH cytochrome family protein